MLKQLKSSLYFPVASYFRLWAKLALARWKPQVILITGSSGKTTLLHLLESQLGTKAHYSHLANSAFGIPFDILGLKPQYRSKLEWISLIIAAPLKAWRRPYPQSLYVVEADSDRPGEAKFIAELVKPERLIWLSSDKSHGGNFGVPADLIEATIAREFGNYLERTSKNAILNRDSVLIMAQTKRTKANIDLVSQHEVTGYQLSKDGTVFTIDGQKYRLPVLVPQEVGLAIAAVVKLCTQMNVQIDPEFKSFTLPPGRSSLLNGIKGSLIIDSTYNAIPDAVRAMLNLFDKFPASNKWLVLGDMIELGPAEAGEHERIAKIVATLKLDRIILIGPRQLKYTAPNLAPLLKKPAVLQAFEAPKAALDYLQSEIRGGETLMFKGARFLEGVVEQLLADPADASKLCRRQPAWQRRRAKWDL